jgi:ABC-type protease/lipase transport system fused ATPase/permease subunit
MHMWSPFQPDAASDWWNFGVNLIAAFSTIFAVVVALRTSRIAAQEARTANDVAKGANERAEQAQRRLEAIELANMEISISGFVREVSTLESDIATEQHHLQVAAKYEDIRAMSLHQGRIDRAELRIGEIEGILAAVDRARVAASG